MRAGRAALQRDRRRRRVGAAACARSRRRRASPRRDGPSGEEPPAGPRRRTAVGTAGAARACRAAAVWPAPARLGAQRRRRHPVHGAHGVVELAHAREARRERHVRHAQRGRLDQQPGGVRAVGARERQRARAQLGRQHPVQVPFGVAEPGREAGHAVALHDAVGDQPHGAGGEVGADVPVRRARHRVGQAAAARAVAALLGRARRRQELHVGALGGGRGAGRSAVDPGGPHRGDEVAVEPGVARGDGAVAAFLVEQHENDSATGPPRLAEIGR